MLILPVFNVTRQRLFRWREKIFTFIYLCLCVRHAHAFKMCLCDNGHWRSLLFYEYLNIERSREKQCYVFIQILFIVIILFKVGEQSKIMTITNQKWTQRTSTPYDRTKFLVDICSFPHLFCSGRPAVESICCHTPNDTAALHRYFPCSNAYSQCK